MSAILTSKKTAFLVNVINAAQALYLANQQLVQLQTQYANAYAAGAADAIVDADCAASGGTQQLTAAIITSFFSGPQAAVATAVSNNLQSLLPVLPY
jgi:hypothetical protein